MNFWSRILRPDRAKSDLDDEIESHLALAAADNRDRGAARRQRGANPSGISATRR